MQNDSNTHAISHNRKFLNLDQFSAKINRKNCIHVLFWNGGSRYNEVQNMFLKMFKCGKFINKRKKCFFQSPVDHFKQFSLFGKFNFRLFLFWEKVGKVSLFI